MLDFPLLTTLIILPIIGALFIYAFIGKNNEEADSNINAMSFWVTMINFIISLGLIYTFDKKAVGFQFVETYNWLPEYGINFKVGIDGISIFFVVLTTFLMLICSVIAKNSIKTRLKEYAISFLLLESFIIGTFAALDVLVFYLFFELMLIPMFLIIGIWGGENRIYASYKFFLYTLAGSIFFLVAFIYIYNLTGTADIVILLKTLPKLLSFEQQKFLWLALFVAFAIKVPMWPFHTWLPDAHVQAPTAGSVLLAGVLIKIGAYGFLRFSIPMLPDATLYFQDFVFVLSIIAIIYTSIVAMMQTDMKKLIAYSSVAHMGYVTLGIFTLDKLGVAGGLFQMISHGIISGALFICVGIMYDKLHTKKIAEINGIASQMPFYAIFFIIFTLGSVALPGTSGFVGEFLVLLGTYQVNKLAAITAAIGVIIGAVYMLWLVKRSIMGTVENQKILELTDISLEQKIILGVLAILVVALGVYPALIFDFTNSGVLNLLLELRSFR